MSEPVHFLSLELDFGFNCLLGGYKLLLLTSRIFSKEKVITDGGKLPFLLLDSKCLGFFFPSIPCLHVYILSILIYSSAFFRKVTFPEVLPRKLLTVSDGSILRISTLPWL